MFALSVFWLWFAGIVILAIGLFTCRKELASAPNLNKLIVLGPLFFAAPLAVFGAEHLVSARFIVGAVPTWMPFRMFWTYFVGVALLAAAFSIVLKIQVRWTATLLAVMFFLFVAMIQVPNVIAKPENRIFWAIALRDLSFAGGACALAATQTGSKWMLRAARLSIALAALFFAAEHFLHPDYAPGVPLAKLIPAWIPLRIVWGYVTGALLLVAGVAVLANKQARAAAVWLGLDITLVVLCVYVPILVADKPAELVEGVNYVADTLLFAGAILLLAAALPKYLRSGSQ